MAALAVRHRPNTSGQKEDGGMGAEPPYIKGGRVG